MSARTFECRQTHPETRQPARLALGPHPTCTPVGAFLATCWNLNRQLKRPGPGPGLVPRARSCSTRQKQKTLTKRNNTSVHRGGGRGEEAQPVYTNSLWRDTRVKTVASKDGLLRGLTGTSFARPLSRRGVSAISQRHTGNAGGQRGGRGKPIGRKGVARERDETQCAAALRSQCTTLYVSKQV